MQSSVKPAAPKMEGVALRSHKLMKGPLSYIGAFFRATKEGLWSPDATDGWIPLVVAENKLSNQAVLDRLEAVKGYPTWVMNYGGMKGTPQLQVALARLMEHTFVQGVALDPRSVCISAGCSAILDNLFYIICNEGEGVLIPAPYYPAFDNDLTAKCHLHPLPFYLHEPAEQDATAATAAADPAATATAAAGEPNGGAPPNTPPPLSIEAQLDAAAAAAEARGIPVRALLITNPNNPLGTVYSPATVRAMLTWCLRRRVHYVSDEIYAKSIYKPAPFVSALTLAQELVGGDGSQGGAGAANGGTNNSSSGGAAAAAGPSNGHAQQAQQAQFSQRYVDTYVHLVYGLSKDWCASGLRVGLLYSRNEHLQQAMESVAPFVSVPNYLQHSLAEALGDLPWADGFLEKNARQLEASYDLLAEALTKEGVPFLPAVGGMFVWIDLRQWLPEGSWEGERRLWDSICDESKIILTPGESCHAEEPGCFRLCFAWVPREALGEAVRRLGQQLRGISAARAAGAAGAAAGDKPKR